MKLDPNMEIDRLLRRQARRGAASSISSAQDEESGNGGGAAERELEDGAHLDADEMNAYAENALPAAARARYMAHLADCDSCRKVVTELVMASGVANELEKQAVAAVPQTSAPARSWLATLFAPHILRYAASVVLVVGLAAIAFIVFRGREARFSSQEEQAQNVAENQNAGGQVAQNQPTGSSNTASPPAAAKPQPGETPKPDATGIISSPEGVPASKDAPADASKSTTTVTTTQGPDNGYVLDGESTDQKEVRRDEDKAGLARQQQASPPPPAPVLEKDKNKQEAATADSSFGADVASSNRRESERDANAKSGAATESKAPASRSNEEQPSTRKRAGGRAASPPKESLAGAAMNDDRAERKDIAAKKAEATRSVGGRQFVRRGDAWIDTAYQSQATTNIKRGSEQYRALVADEPGLRSIADQLGGEVVVVWKGRAYRIR
jgi:hypothetical protein